MTRERRNLIGISGLLVTAVVGMAAWPKSQTRVEAQKVAEKEARVQEAASFRKAAQDILNQGIYVRKDGVCYLATPVRTKYDTYSDGPLNFTFARTNDDKLCLK